VTYSIVPVDAGFLASLVRASGELVKELKIVAGPEGVSFSAMDPANVAFVYWRIGAEYFRELPSEEVVLFVNQFFPDAFKGVKKGDELSVVVEERSIGVVIVRGSSKVRRTVPRMDFGDEYRGMDVSRVEKLFSDSSAKCSFDSSSISEALKEFPQGGGERLSLNIVPEGLVLFFSDESLRGSSVLLSPSVKGDSAEGSGLGRYSVEYLFRAISFFKELPRCCVGWSRDSPIVLAGDLGSSRVVVCVAPVVDND